MKIIKSMHNQKIGLFFLIFIYILSITVREVIPKNTMLSYIVLTFALIPICRSESSYLKSKLSNLDLVYASIFSGLMPRYLSVMALGLTGQLVLGPPRFYSFLPLILASIIEEFYYRAKLYDELKTWVKKRNAYLITICLYSLFHIPLFDFFKLLPLLPIFLLLGILFQELRLKWGLTSSVIAHIIYNILGMFYIVSFELLSVLIIASSLIATILLVKFLA